MTKPTIDQMIALIKKSAKTKYEQADMASLQSREYPTPDVQFLRNEGDTFTAILQILLDKKREGK